MPLIQLPQRHLVQPQYPAPIDLQGLGKGIQLLFNPAAGPVDLATGRIWTPGGDASVVAGQKGKAFSFDGTDDYYGYTGYPEITGNVGTFFLWCPIVGPADPNGHLFFGHSSPTVVWYQVSNIGSLYLLGIEGGGTISWYNTANRSLIFSSGGTAATAKAYLDGRDSGVVWGAAPTSWGVGNKNFNLGRYVGGSSWDFNGSILVAGYTAAVWGAAEAKAFHQNPWSLFKAPARRLWTTSSSGTTDATGSSAGVSNVSGVGASIASASGSSSGSATVSGFGSFVSEGSGAGSLSGVATVSGVGASAVESAGLASGSATVSGTGDSSIPGAAVGSVSGTSTTSGAGASTAESSGFASGMSTVSGLSPSVSGGFSGPLSFGKVKPRKYRDRDRDEIRKSLLEQLEEKVEELQEDVSPPEVPQAIKTHVAQITKEYREPSIDLKAMERDILHVRALLKSCEEEVKRRRDEEDEELLFMFL